MYKDLAHEQALQSLLTFPPISCQGLVLVQSLQRLLTFLLVSCHGLAHVQALLSLPTFPPVSYLFACLCYHCHSSTAPSYVTDMLNKKPLHTRNTRSSSYTMPLLNRPAHSKATLGDRSFSFASSSARNSIPNDVRCAPSLS